MEARDRAYNLFFFLSRNSFTSCFSFCEAGLAWSAALDYAKFACPSVPLVDAFDKEAHASKACPLALPLLNRLLYIHTKPCSHQSSSPASLPLKSQVSTPPASTNRPTELSRLTN
jgi:hypothetical protein